MASRTQKQNRDGVPFQERMESVSIQIRAYPMLFLSIRLFSHKQGSLLDISLQLKWNFRIISRYLTLYCDLVFEVAPLSVYMLLNVHLISMNDPMISLRCKTINSFYSSYKPFRPFPILKTIQYCQWFLETPTDENCFARDISFISFDLQYTFVKNSTFISQGFCSLSSTSYTYLFVIKYIPY